MVRYKFLGVKNKMKLNLLLETEYADIIVSLIKKPYKVNSITKLIFLSFGVKHASIKKYSNRKMNFIKVFLSSLSIKLTSHPEDLKAILKVISILEMGGWITVDNDNIKIMKLPPNGGNNPFLRKLEDKKTNFLVDISKLENKSFLEEVLQYV